MKTTKVIGRDANTGRFVKHAPAWNKGLTKYTDGSVLSISKTLKGKTPDLHILETRECVCGCKESFECSVASRKRFVQGHNRRGMACSDYVKSINSKRMLGENNPAKDPRSRKLNSLAHLGKKQSRELVERRIRAAMKAVSASPNFSESQLHKFLQFHFPDEFSLNVRGEIMLLGGKVPDFVNTNGKKQIIELFGEHWHTPEEEKIRIDYFKTFRYDTLIVWVQELRHRKVLQAKINKFVNGSV
jgi:hypothetical protein